MVAGGAALAWWAPGPQAWLAQERAPQAWEVPRGDLLREEADVLRSAGAAEAPLARARALYLEGRFLDCLDALPEDADDLRRQAEDALLVDVPWPATVIRTKRLAEAGPDDRKLLARVVDDGPGEGLRLEVVGLRSGRHRRLDLELRDPAGHALREGSLQRLPLGDLARFDSPRLGAQPALRVEHRRDGSPTLDILVGTPRGMTVFRFRGDRMPTLSGGDVSVPGEAGQEPARWRWTAGHFLRR